MKNKTLPTVLSCRYRNSKMIPEYRQKSLLRADLPQSKQRILGARNVSVILRVRRHYTIAGSERKLPVGHSSALLGELMPARKGSPKPGGCPEPEQEPAKTPKSFKGESS